MFKILTGMTTAALVFALAAHADDTPDASFYQKAAEGGIAEVELGELAQEKSLSPDVRDFAGMMITDHSAANERLKAIAARKNINLPTSPGVTQIATKSKQQVLSGMAFDKAYIRGMVADHQEDIEEFEKEAASGQDPDARGYAAATLPALREHLKKIQAIAAAHHIKVR